MSFQRQYDFVQCRTMSYRRWNDVMCLMDSHHLFIDEMNYDKNSYLNIHVVAENYYFQLIAKTLLVNEFPGFFDEQSNKS